MCIHAANCFPNSWRTCCSNWAVYFNPVWEVREWKQYIVLGRGRR